MNAARGRVPGAFARLLRQPQRLGAILLLCVTAISAAGIQSSAALVLHATIDAQWRGDYDILVTATDELGTIDGLLAPNALGGGGDGMSISDWAAVGAVDGVEVAAPIGHVLVPGLKYAPARLAVPSDLVPPEDGPQAFRVTTTFTTDDGLGERAVSRERTPLIIDPVGVPAPTEAEIQECVETSEMGYGTSGGDTYRVNGREHPELVRFFCDNSRWFSGATANMPSGEGWGGSAADPGTSTIMVDIEAPNPAVRIDLIDPASERALLGARGAFLDPLVELDADAEIDAAALQTWADGADTVEAATLAQRLLRLADENLELYPPEVLDELRALYAENGADFDAEIDSAITGFGVAPILFSEIDPATLTMRVDIEAFGPTNASERVGYELPAALADDAPGTIVGTSVGDVSELLNPFGAANAGVVWPGAQVAEQPGDTSLAGMAQQISIASSVSPMSYRVSEGLLVLEAAGFVPSIRAFGERIALGDDGHDVGTESAYLEPSMLADLSLTGAVAAVPVGSFDPSDAAIDESEVNYVPLGAYGSIDTTVVDGAHRGATMSPGLSGLGLVAAETVAIGSIHSAALWKDDAPISSIRVRVDGVDGYTDEGRERVLRVAQDVAALGFATTIVAGSSPTEAAVLVEDYAFGTPDPEGAQEVGELGVVAQQWSELGAASRVDLAVSAGSWSMLVVALAAGVLLLGATQVAAVPGRRQQSIVLRELGFTRRRIARWFAAEEVPALGIVAVIGVAAWWASGWSRVAALAVLVMLAALVVASAFSVLAAARVRPAAVRDSRSRRRGARSVIGFGLRQALMHPMTSIVHAVSIVIVGGAAAALVQAVLTSRTAAGESGIAQLVGVQLLVPQIALGVVGVVGGLLLARLVRRLDLERRSDQWGLLRAAGWTGGQVATAQRAEGMMIVLPALLLTGVLVVAATMWLGAWSLWPPAVGVAAAAFSALLSFTARSRGRTL